MTLPLPIEPPDGEGVSGQPDPQDAMPRLVARREYSLRSLLELSRELSVSLGPHETAELLLLNLMGQFGTARAALWILTGPPQGPVLIRSHGYRSHAVNAVLDACQRPLLQHLAQIEGPCRREDLQGLAPAELALLAQVDVALLARLESGETHGLLALGSRLDHLPYSEVDLHTLEAALGMVGMSLQNSRLYGRLLENNRQLRTANERLLEHDRLKSEFLSNVNHELRTPLAVVIAALECLLEQRGLEESARELLSVAVRKAGALKDMIENLLTFSDAIQGRLLVEVAPGDLRPVLEAFRAERQPGVSEGLRELRLECDPDLPPVRFDPHRLRQILDELMDNALKFTPRGSHIDVRAQPWQIDGRQFVRVTFTDDGPGIPPERLGSVLRSFEQVDGSWTREVGGLGVGLAFADQLARQMGAGLQVESALGEGTTFTLLLPAA